MKQHNIGPNIEAPIRDFIAFHIMVLAGLAHNLFSVFSRISPNSERAVTGMQIVPEKDGIRFSTARDFNGRKIPVGTDFFMRRQDLEFALQKLEEKKASLND
jgi:hypothetical protein